MAQLVVRNLGEDVKARLKARARKHGRSLEAEVREVLTEAARGEDLQEDEVREGLGTRIRKRLGKSELSREEWDEFDRELAQIRKEWGGSLLSRAK